MHWASRFSLVVAFLLAWPLRAWCEDVPASPNEAVRPLKGHVLILVGLPGDGEHEQLFADTVKSWRKWLTGPLGFNSAEIRVLFGKSKPKEGFSDGPATREAIENEAARLKETLQPDERLWVFFLGHANFDDEHAWFNIPGPDLNENDLGKLFAELKCQEQIFWLTTSESGRFLKSFSAKGRIVIAATRSEKEDNETEFPQALSAVAGQSLEELDLDKDGKLSVLEVYYRVLVEVQARYVADKLIATEHQQLDDNGDGLGAERPLASDEGERSPGEDGSLAYSCFLPYLKPLPRKESEKPKDNPPLNSEADHGKSD
jgi:hypothetical protein